MNLVDSFVRIVRMSAKLKCLRSATKNLIFLPLLVSAESRPNQTVRSRPEVSAKSFLKGPEVLWWWWAPEEHFYGQSKATSFRLRLNTGDRPRWSTIALHIFVSLSQWSNMIPYIWEKPSKNMRDFMDFPSQWMRRSTPLPSLPSGTNCHKITYFSETLPAPA